MSKKKTFISYDYDNDRSYKNLLLAWDKNKLFDFYISDVSTDVSIDSYNSTAIKRAISTKINEGNYFLCIIGKHTFNSSWVKWEIDKAVELKKKIIAVKIENDNISPSNIIGIGASWALSFSFESISKAINNA